jgi:hypothetical protein
MSGGDYVNRGQPILFVIPWILLLFFFFSFMPDFYKQYMESFYLDNFFIAILCEFVKLCVRVTSSTEQSQAHNFDIDHSNLYNVGRDPRPTTSEVWKRRSNA